MKELKNFTKVFLEPGQEKTVEMTLDKRSFAWYNTRIHDWYAATGDYEILAGASSRDIRLTKTVRFVTETKLPFHIHRNTTVAELLADERTAPVIRSMMTDLASDMTGGGDNSSEAASEAITPEMTLKMLENSPPSLLQELLRTVRGGAVLSHPDTPGGCRHRQVAPEIHTGADLKGPLLFYLKILIFICKLKILFCL